MESAKYINQKGVMVETKIKATIEAGKRNIMRDAKTDGLEHVRMLYILSQIKADLFSRSMSPGPFVFSVVDGTGDAELTRSRTDYCHLAQTTPNRMPFIVS